MKKLFAIITFIILLSTFVLPAYANSAPTDWAGVDVTGMVMLDENCPLEVTKEVLTFDISEFPESYYEEKDDYLAYSAKLIAEYSFYNPTDTEITATLAFPFGETPEYVGIYDKETKSYNVNLDIDKYDITVNGAPIKKNVRYTLNDYEFDLNKSIMRLRDSYTSHSFYSPDMTVTKYTYIVGGKNGDNSINKIIYPDAYVAFDWNRKSGKTKLCFPGYHDEYILNNGDIRVGVFAENAKTITLYAIGEPFEQMPQWKCYKDVEANDNDVIKGGVELVSTDTMTFESFALKYWNENIGVSKIDWYNAVVDSLDEGSGVAYNFIDRYLGTFYMTYMTEDELSSIDFTSNFMRWYQYEIIVPPKSSIVNSVTAPIYPTIDKDFEPSVYHYKYLLSPASKWANFKEIEININTPFYITDCSIDEFIKTENGYTYRQEGLPSGELEFSLCESENPERADDFIFTFLSYLSGGVLVSGVITIFLIIAFIGAIVCAVILIVKNNEKKKNQ